MEKNKRRLTIGDRKYKVDRLTRHQKFIVQFNHYNPDEWLFISETDSYLRIVKKGSLDGNPIVKNLNKYCKF